jgi:hypothetical protein
MFVLLSSSLFNPELAWNLLQMYISSSSRWWSDVQNKLLKWEKLSD